MPLVSARESLAVRTSFLSGTCIEILNPHLDRGHIRHALFDFDGTISLIREGWQQVMIPMMVEILLELGTGETEEELTALVTEFVDRLTGKQTIYQMIQLSEEVRKRGGDPLDPLDYKWMYLDRLWKRIKGRVAALRAGRVEPEQMMVPGSLDILDAMHTREVTCYLASGTDEPYVLDEATALGITPCFAGIYGALDDYQSYSKRMVIERIISENQLSGSQFVAFGDASWRSRMPGPWEASPWAWPPTRRPAAESTSGSAIALFKPAPTSSSPTSGSMSTY